MQELVNIVVKSFGNMKKYLIVIGTAVLLLVVGLSGCVDDILNSNDVELVNTWIDKETGLIFR